MYIFINEKCVYNYGSELLSCGYFFKFTHLYFKTYFLFIYVIIKNSTVKARNLSSLLVQQKRNSFNILEFKILYSQLSCITQFTSRVIIYQSILPDSMFYKTETCIHPNNFHCHIKTFI